MPTCVLYHCPCSTDFSSSFGPVQPSSSAHPLPSLYFCEECDSTRCQLCTTTDLTAYYCSNCLFDVPLASIKSERAKCPRNCFSCPICTSTLAVVASDPTDDTWAQRSSLSSEASTGEPPWYLACPTCRWDSKEVGLTFEKPTGLSLQVQRHEDNAADAAEFNRLRQHFDAQLRVNADTPSSLATARSSKLLRDVPSSLASDPLFGPNRAAKGTRRGAENGENFPVYSASMTWDGGRDPKRYIGVKQGWEDGKALGVVGRREQKQLDFLGEQHDDRGLSCVEQRWTAIADQSVRAADLGPCRMSLQTKKTRRCSVCRHIIIRPDSKPTSSRYKIRLLALNHLPELQIRPPNTAAPISSDDRRRSAHPSSLGRRKTVVVDEENLHPGRTYMFEASFLNPLDDPMTVRLHIARPPSYSITESLSQSKHATPTKATTAASNKFHWTVTPTSNSFQVRAFNAVWELDEEDSDLLELGRHARHTDPSNTLDDDDDDDDDDVQDAKDDGIDEEEDEMEMGDDRDHKRSRTNVSGKREGRKRGQGILRRKGHETTIGLELALSRDATGEVEFPMQVTFTYRPEASSGAKEAESKSFSFWTFVRLGRINSDYAAQAAAGGLASPSDPSVTEARRTALDKRRSIMGLNVGISKVAPAVGQTHLSPGQPTSPMSSLKVAAGMSGEGSPRRMSGAPISSPTRRGGGAMLGQVSEQQEADAPTSPTRMELSMPRDKGSLAELSDTR